MKVLMILSLVFLGCDKGELVGDKVSETSEPNVVLEMRMESRVPVERSWFGIENSESASIYLRLTNIRDKGFWISNLVDTDLLPQSLVLSRYEYETAEWHENVLVCPLADIGVLSEKTDLGIYLLEITDVVSTMIKEKETLLFLSGDKLFTCDSNIGDNNPTRLTLPDGFVENSSNRLVISRSSLYLKSPQGIFVTSLESILNNDAKWVRLPLTPVNKDHWFGISPHGTAYVGQPTRVEYLDLNTKHLSFMESSEATFGVVGL